jgi:hypothetical protein
MLNDNRPVDLLSDSTGIYGIGILYDNLIDWPAPGLDDTCLS